MPSDPYQQFVVLAFTGVGLLLAAAVNLILKQTSSLRCLAATALVCSLAPAACWAFEGNDTLLEPLGTILLAVLLPAIALTTPRGSGLLIAAVERARRPLAVWWVCGLSGAVIIVASAVRYEVHDERALDAAMKDLESLENLELQTNHSNFLPAPVLLTTDRGSEIIALENHNPRAAEEQVRVEDEYFRLHRDRDYVIRWGPADDRTNCFGIVFTGGRYWIPGSEQIERILLENGYRTVVEPRLGDIVIYRLKGKIEHIAVVRYLAKHQPVLVEGKWGYGGLYLHAVDKSSYGSDFEYFRSPRIGHLLAGMPAEGEVIPKENELTE